MQKALTASRAFTPRSSPRWAISVAAVGAVLTLIACGQGGGEPAAPAKAPAATGKSSPESIPMGGAKSVTRFFVTSRGPGKGGDLGGLAGADAHCQSLAKAEGSGDHTWRAYLSTSATPNQPAVNARDRIGKGPWYNAEGSLVAANLDELHSDMNKISKETAVTERLDQVSGVGDTPNMHDILTGSRPDGTAFDARDGACLEVRNRRAGIRLHDWQELRHEGVERSPRCGDEPIDGLRVDASPVFRSQRTLQSRPIRV